LIFFEQFFLKLINLGFETSSTTATFVLYNLATHPDIQEKVREEITSTIARNDGNITFETMQEMKYLNMVVEG
jgi:cytochrome P450 family 6